MHISAPFFLAIAQWVITISAIPIPNMKGLEAGLQPRQFEIFANTDDSGALYAVETPVAGTNSYRDADGFYHDVPRRRDKRARNKREANSNAALSSSATVVGSLLARALPMLRVAQDHESPKGEKSSLSIVEREIGQEASADKAAADGVLEKLDRGERIYF